MRHVNKRGRQNFWSTFCEWPYSLNNTCSAKWSAERSVTIHPRVIWSIGDQGYKDVVVHVSLFEIFHNGIFSDLGEKHHVINTTLLDILALPVILTALKERWQKERGNRVTNSIYWPPWMANDLTKEIYDKDVSLRPCQNRQLL